MGKSLGDTGKLVNLVKHLKSSKQAKQATTTSGNQRVLGQEKLKKKKTTTTTKMESSSDIHSINNNKNNNSSSNISDTRVPLSEVVSDCVKRWFKDTLKEAKAGDINMQVLVAQMYYSGYGIPRDAQKGRGWMTRASRTRSSVWKVSDKHPGYNASDSDSDELNGHS